MKKIIISILICSIIQSTTLCMKRMHEDTHNILSTHINKKAKKEIIKPTSLANFFINDNVFEKPIPTDDNKNTSISSNALLPDLPNDIKNTIRTHQFFYNQEWWYTTKKILLQKTPYGASFINDTLTIASGKTIIMIDQILGTILERIVDTNALILSLASHNNYLAYGLNDGTVNIIDLTTKKSIFNYITNSTPWALAFDKNGDHIAIGLKNNSIEIVSIKKQNTILAYSSTNIPYGLSFLNSHNLAYGENKGELYLINLQTKTNNFILKTPTPLFAQSYSNDDTSLAIGLLNGDLQIINPQTNHVKLTAHFKAPVYCLAFDQTGDKLAVGTDDRSLSIMQRFHPTPHQLMLRKLFTLWLQVKKHNEAINSISLALDSIVTLFHLDKTEVLNTWETFPAEIQNAIWYKIKTLIKKYGHPSRSMDFYCLSEGIDTMKFTELNARITSGYSNPTAKQLLLRKIIQVFFNTQKITAPINSPRELLTVISCAFNIYNVELLAIWLTFPNNVKQELWEQFDFFIRQKTT